ncbi:MAG: DUF1134 domain-containing protein [Gammaproteobacteria bacterium]
MKRLFTGIQFLALAMLISLPAVVRAEDEKPDIDVETDAGEDGYSQESVLTEATNFFGEGAENVADVIADVFEDLGRPNAYIKGNEASGAFIVGARYGDGQLFMKSGGGSKLHWTGPSIGFDAGGNVSKVFVLIYQLPSVQAIFKRFPAVDGSFYLVGGVSANYHQGDGIVLVPIRLGAGLRSGVNIGYMHYTLEKTWNPF